MADVLQAEGKSTESRATLQELFRVYPAVIAVERKKGQTPHFAMVLDHYGSYLRKAGQLAEAETQARQAQAIRHSTGVTPTPPSPPTTTPVHS